MEGSSAGGSRCKRFEGKTVLITAATAGIGKAIAERLAEEGAAVFLCSRCAGFTKCSHHASKVRICQLLLTGFPSSTPHRKQQSVDETVAVLKAKGYKAAGCACHVGNPQQLKAFVEAGVKVSNDVAQGCVQATGSLQAPAPLVQVCIHSQKKAARC
jgi:NAD(P)-dependent dehydrogenase (short-subunit alcohol dehydrogenase family)